LHLVTTSGHAITSTRGDQRTDRHPLLLRLAEHLALHRVVLDQRERWPQVDDDALVGLVTDLGLLYERERMRMEASRRDTVIQNLTARLDEANLHPVRWAARRLWWRLQPILVQGAVLLTLGALVWFGLRSR
jgi:hypothetical protein